MDKAKDQPKKKKKPTLGTVYFWSVKDVGRWLKKNMPEMAEMYLPMFLYHEISGRIFVHLNDDKLKLMGIENEEHREAIVREVLKLKLSRDVHEFKLLSEKGMFQR